MNYLYLLFRILLQCAASLIPAAKLVPSHRRGALSRPALHGPCLSTRPLFLPAFPWRDLYIWNYLPAKFLCLSHPPPRTGDAACRVVASRLPRRTTHHRFLAAASCFV